MIPPRIASLGECMLELARGPDGEARLGFGGDTLNTALYLSRLGVEVRYATALGAYPWSEQLRQAWAEEGIGLDLVLCDPDRVGGLYAIRTDDQGERSYFTYWRENSAARQFFKLADSERACTEIASADVVYLSGISLSLFDALDRARLTTFSHQCGRAAGGSSSIPTIALATGHRPTIRPRRPLRPSPHGSPWFCRPSKTKPCYTETPTRNKPVKDGVTGGQRKSS